jgi:uncharacterized membrane protein YphA (DoxX/SURF4 family)
MSDLLDSLRQAHVQLLLRLLVGGLLLIAGVSKLTDRQAFRAAVTDYDILPASLARPFAYLTPFVEVALGALLLIGLFTVEAAALAVPLFASFSIAIGVNIARGRHLDCHCFGSSTNDRVGPTALLRSLLLTVGALYVAFGASRFGALDALVFGTPDGLPPVSEAIPMFFIAFVVVDVLFLLPELVATRASFRERQASHQHGAHA